MPKSLEISPNEPDVVPDYVDFAPAPAAVGSRSATAPDASRDASLSAVGLAPAAAVWPADLNEDGAAEAPPPAAGRAPAPAPSETHREGECVPNVPDPLPDVVNGAEAVIARTRPEPAAPPPDAEAPWLRRHLIGTVLMVGVLGIVVFGQAISALAMAATLPAWAQWLLLVPLGACCLAVLWVCVGLVRSWLRLRSMRQVDLDALEELRRRAKTRRDGVEHFQGARIYLEGYLENYAIGAQNHDAMREAGFSAEALEKMTKNRDFLLDRPIDSRSWLEEFRTQFQSSLDRTAEARVRAWALKAAGCVIASPLPLLDAVLVLGICFKLIKDLTVIYNVRSTRAGTLILLKRAVTATFIAGVAENITERAAEEIAGAAGEGTLGTLGASLAGALGPKLGEGAVNAFFMHRLGRSAISLLQPLKPK